MIPNISDSELRARIYREAMIDAENENKRLREEHRLLREGLDRSIKGHAETDAKLIEANRRMKRYQEEILDLERHNEELFAALARIRNLLVRAGDDIETLIRVD